MSTDLIKPPETHPIAVPAEVLAGVEDLLSAKYRPNTRKAYTAAWKQFEKWCTEHGVASLPAQEATIMWYFQQMSQKYKVNTISLKMSAINKAHRLAGYSGFDLKNSRMGDFFGGIRNTLGNVERKAAPLTIDLLRRICDGDISTRDRALLTVGFAGAMRRSEIVNLNWSDVEFVESGLKLTLLWTKTDKERKGVVLGICYGNNINTCPVRAMKALREEFPDASDAVFRAVDRNGHPRKRLTAPSVCAIVRKHVERIGLDKRSYSGHSLRAGFITTAAMCGIDSKKIMDQSRHVSFEIMRQYIRLGSLFNGNASGMVGL